MRVIAAIVAVAVAGWLLYDPVMNAVFVDRDGIGTELSTPSPAPTRRADAPRSIEPEPMEPDPIGLGEPPDAFINDVAGQLVTYCWTNGCADGVVTDPTTLPSVVGPYVVTLPGGAEIAGVTAWGPAAPNPAAVEVPHTATTFGRVPENSVMLSIFVYFEQGGDAAYYWALGDSP
ncbi:MAG TPA: hypothetical protein VFP30_08610 [Candidatus Limnocylindria bacterium]|nr:hypothetical protein [Candidatus Limnocylindria bacterium]